MSRAARNAGAGIDDARPLHLAREDRIAERQRGTVAVAEIAHGGEAGAQRLHPVRLGIEGLRGGAARDFLALAGDAARVTRQMAMAADEAGGVMCLLQMDRPGAGSWKMDVVGKEW